jgi:predicted NUDIX family NTP pyrophosphohydrolase
MIQPLETNSFIASQRTTYEEVGIVIEGPEELKGKKVYFDSWLAKKYPVTGKTDEYVWFVKYEDLVAHE